MVKNFNLFFWLAIMLSILSLSLFIPEWTDYFGFSAALKENKITDYLWNGYLKWDGRFLSLSALIQCFLVLYFPHVIIVLFYSALFLINGLLIGKILDIQIKGEKRILLHILIIISLFYGFYSHISETVFWAVGGVYTLHLFFGLILILYLKYGSKQFVKYDLGIVVLLSLISGSTSQNFSPALIIYLAYFLIFIPRESDKNRYWFALGGLLAGLSIISLAPGNFIRANGNESNFNLDVIWLMKLFVGITLRYLKFSLVLIAFAIFSALLMAGRMTYTAESFKKHLKADFVWFLMALATVAPMVFVPSETSLRTSIFFMAFLYVFVFKMSSWFFVHNKFFLGNKLIFCILICLVVTHFYMMSIEYRDGSTAQSARKSLVEDIISQKQQGQDTIVIFQPALPMKAFTINYNKYRITSNSNNWINKQHSSYYGLTAIVNSSSDVE